jgi:hypothetical protein
VGNSRSDSIAYRTPVPLQRWHFTTLSPFLNRPFPSQFLHNCFFFMFGPFSLVIGFSRDKQLKASMFDTHAIADQLLRNALAVEAKAFVSPDFGPAQAFLGFP